HGDAATSCPGPRRAAEWDSESLFVLWGGPAVAGAGEQSVCAIVGLGGSRTSAGCPDATTRAKPRQPATYHRRGDQRRELYYVPAGGRQSGLAWLRARLRNRRWRDATNHHCHLLWRELQGIIQLAAGLGHGPASRQYRPSRGGADERIRLPGGDW